MFNQPLQILLCLIATLLVGCGGSTQSEEKVAEEIVTTPPLEEDTTSNETIDVQPNILLIISDDQGLDSSAQYNFSDDLPNTPTLDALAAQGLTFENMWATPACSTTRGTIITGKYGINSGITTVPATLTNQHEILQQYLKRHIETENYQSAVFGKWHLNGGNAGSNINETHPNDVGIDYYAGNLANLTDYYNWPLTTNGITESSTDYHSTKITNLAIDWLDQQTSPWFAWVAYSAPHSPFHLPPESLHNRRLVNSTEAINNNKRSYYLAAIEAMDAEIGRLINSMDEETRENTIIIFMGDNGTPASVIDTTAYQTSHSKGSLYQGGVAVPFIVSGKGVNRINERESALVTATDLYATVGEVAGVTSTKVHDSLSFKALFSDQNTINITSDYIYTAFESLAVTGWSVRSREYKLITLAEGTEELYSMTNDFSETNNLLPTNDPDLINSTNELKTIAKIIYGDEVISPIDITNTTLVNKSQNCADYVEQFTSTVNDINKGVVFYGELSISVVADKCLFKTNAIPNHDFNDGGSAFPNNVSEQNDLFEITTLPTKANQRTNISLQLDNAILLNGVKVDLLAAGCFGIGNGKVGCNDNNQPWRYDPMHAENGFQVDSHNAHAQPDGTYHYHGSPFALFDNSDSESSPVIGFAADGFPIVGSYFDDQGSIRKARSSYRLKAGRRPSGTGEPGGVYDGTFRDDYEYVEGFGDLDECNGMDQNGVYAYYITDNYPYVLACFSGTPDSSFNK